ncbi:QacE family quaternary ammonium compound efflux SMR transporter [Helicobacter sp. 16-1353]|uniref:DMT family transporter n=1 Tax=Helicobacter sp. 16-1353 TaxID=2004996 RepID=UPI000DCC6E88|nr:SMR family transporter [Helicobacter sp. 16-1353]RAX54441.1 QacE family quaternary ammonium compound efflux SMR transporter [Helicobacter sp. 16-1353]
MSWIFLIVAGCMEIAGVFTMKKFATTNKKIFILPIALLFMVSLSFLSLAMQGISMGVAYAIWTGIGASGGVLVGILVFGESASFLKIFFIFIIIASAIGLKALG